MGSHTQLLRRDGRQRWGRCVSLHNTRSAQAATGEALCTASHPPQAQLTLSHLPGLCGTRDNRIPSKDTSPMLWPQHALQAGHHCQLKLYSISSLSCSLPSHAYPYGGFLAIGNLAYILPPREAFGDHPNPQCSPAWFFGSFLLVTFSG